MKKFQVPHWFQRAQKNPLFRLLSSVRLAIPTLATLGVVVGWGTILESRYGATYARWAIYEQSWFWLLLGLVGVNVLFAALSRIPYQRHHTGFVITHIGILILLGGSFVTARWGIDGQLRIAEGNLGATVELPQLAFEVVSGEVFRKVRLPRQLSALDEDQLSEFNQSLPFAVRLKRLLPFAEVGVELREDPEHPQRGVAVGFQLKSPMFQVAEWLHTTARPEEQMGPALLRLIEGDFPAKGATRAQVPRKPSTGQSQDGFLHVYRVSSGQQVAKLPVSELRKSRAEVEGVGIQLTRAYQQAVVSANHLSEGEGGRANPALELQIINGKQVQREVAYALFPQFSLHKEGIAGLRFEYKTDAPSMKTEGEVSLQSGAPNLIEFAVQNQSDQVAVRLLKAGQEVLRQTLAPGESLQTPWMGMVLTLGSVKRNVVPMDQVQEVEPREKEPLPGGAIQFAVAQPTGSRNFWLREGESREVSAEKGPLHVRLGADYFKLPFQLRLVKFIKTDYPGSQMAQEYESHVEVEGGGETHRISMNQPLKKDGFTLYQSSFEMAPGRPTVSIFSVNRDPGRFWKYLGSLVMSVGIVIFTLYRSRLARESRRPNP